MNNSTTHSNSFPLSFQPCFHSIRVLSCSGEMHELDADRDPDGEAPWRLQGTGAVLLPGRTQVLHPLAAVTQEREGQE